MKKIFKDFFNHFPKFTKGFIVLLFFIATDELANNSVLRAISGISSEAYWLTPLLTKVFLLILFLGSQIIASPLQASISDFSCRKKSIRTSLIISSIAVSFLFFENIIFLILLIIIKGLGGNTLPMAWAGIADEHVQNKDSESKNFSHPRQLRNSFAISILVIAWGYVIFKSISLASRSLSINFNLFILAFCLASLPLCLKYYFDKRDKDKTQNLALFGKLQEEKSEILNDYLRNRAFIYGLCMFLCWEISFYSAQFLDADAGLSCFKNLTLYMASGYTIGTVFLLLSKKSNQKLIGIGYAVSLFSLVPIFLVYLFIAFSTPVLLWSYFIYGIGSSLLTPSLISLLSLIQRNAHKQGKTLGLVESSDTCALLIASIISSIFVYLFAKECVSSIIVPISSMLLMLISLLFNRKFKKLTSKNGAKGGL